MRLAAITQTAWMANTTPTSSSLTPLARVTIGIASTASVNATPARYRSGCPWTAKSSIDACSRAGSHRGLRFSMKR